MLLPPPLPLLLPLPVSQSPTHVDCSQSPTHPHVCPPAQPLSALQVWKDGQKVDELVGAAKDRLKALIEKHA